MYEGLEQLAAQAPAGRPTTPEEIGEAIVFLATDRSSFIPGGKARRRWRSHSHLRDTEVDDA
jgi:NAD(P)-dependent dehydrogenase (short-subunit alcohol dehydrogenase family)